MKQQELIYKEFTFRVPCTESMAILLREVADFLDSAPDVEQYVQDIIISEYVSEPTEETYPDCVQMHEARVFAIISSEFNNTRIGDLRK